MVGVLWAGAGQRGASAFFALLFHAPKRSILPASLVAVAGYGVYLVGEALTGSVVAGNFFGAMAIGRPGRMAGPAHAHAGHHFCVGGRGTAGARAGALSDYAQFGAK